MQRGVATFTLDYGKCPPWLWQRMVKLGREMTRVLIEEYGPDEFIRRIADPVWFQSFGTVLAFDWNASGLTTILTAAIKEAIRGREREFGVFVCGGKGKTSRKTPDEILGWGECLSLPETHTQNLVYNSRMSAKVDSALIHDGYQIYHHSFFFSLSRKVKSLHPGDDPASAIGAWAVVQQGMNTEKQSARRYHWFSDSIKDLIQEPHSGIASQSVDLAGTTLNMTAQQSMKNRDLGIELVGGGYVTLMKDIQILRKHSSKLSKMISVTQGKEQLTLLELAPREFGPTDHPVIHEDFSKSKYLEKILDRVCGEQPKSYEQLLATPGVGPKTIRALSLVGEVIYGARPSYEDPARYSFAHGGKDATPYPVDRSTYDQTIDMLKNAVGKTKLDNSDKEKALERLSA